MSDNFGIVFARELTDQGFADLLKSIGGDVVDPNRPHEGRVSVGDSHNWPLLSNDSLESFVEDVKEEVIRKLGGEPRAAITVELGHSPGNRAVFRTIVERLGMIQRFVILDFFDNVFTPQEWLAAAVAPGNDGV